MLCPKEHLYIAAHEGLTPYVRRVDLTKRIYKYLPFGFWSIKTDCEDVTCPENSHWYERSGSELHLSNVTYKCWIVVDTMRKTVLVYTTDRQGKHETRR